MKAVLLKKTLAAGVLGAALSDVAVPSIGPGEVLVEMKACGLCGTDIEKLRGEYTAAMPVIGHEAVGVVSKVGRDVVGLKEGDRVFPHHHVPCYECYYCKRGEETMCSEYKTSNLDPGGFSELFRVPAWNVSKGGVLHLPSDLNNEEATFVEPVACCIRAFDKVGVGEGDSVLVVGAGPVGITHALLSRYRKALAIVSDVSEPRLDFAEKVGVQHTIDAGSADVPEVVRVLTEGRGADVAIVAAGTQKAIVQGVRSVRRGGTVCLFGIPAVGTILDYGISEIYSSGLSIVCSYGATESDTTGALKLILEHQSDFRSMVTHRYPLSEFGTAVEKVTSGEGMKVVITS